MNDRQPQQAPIFWFAVQFELALGVTGLVAAWLTNTPPQWVLEQRPDPWRHIGEAIAIGLAGALGLLILLWISQHVPLRPLRELRETVDRLLLPLFRGARWWQLLAVSLAAGFGEELLFRAWLQTAVEHWWDHPSAATVGWIVAAVAFGACHWLSTTYAIIATLIGLVLGWIYTVSGHVAAPMIAHAVYDFFALIYLLRTAPD